MVVGTADGCGGVFGSGLWFVCVCVEKVLVCLWSVLMVLWGCVWKWW